MVNGCQDVEEYMRTFAVAFSMVFAPGSWNPKKLALALLRVWAILLTVYTLSFFLVCDSLPSLPFLQKELGIVLICVLFVTTVKSLTRYFFPKYYKTHIEPDDDP